ncbi:hypothetical protein SAMN05660909_00223 [Chitinophaga terrae (ex Kim and Jung 2007)]|uniref:Bacteriocin n=1 Tax=Chitinophaga terrae (ex Kim and Jung 2007) TaxID=408074 RepID=A0A1H3X2E3_9BACT|nr:hypothetical protein [Chitinophaga terrae (ex Kim and Jung 2007)]SDZ93413.1 hypothetical protein SAMN05660909_00223 [Chitinophaga terrae (ex Kim and Jung 2007)]
MKFENLNSKIFKPLKKEQLIAIKGGTDSFTRTVSQKTKKEDSSREAD